MTTIKELAETAAYLVASVGGPITAVWALLQWRDSLKQRKKEHRWRQADMGRQLIDELFDKDAEAGIALELIDGEKDAIEIAGDGPIPVSWEDITAALSKTSGSSAKSRQIRRHFDALFYHLERFENMIRLGLINQEDIRNPTRYYCRKMAPLAPVMEKYLREVGYTGALALIRSLQSAH